MRKRESLNNAGVNLWVLFGSCSNCEKKIIAVSGFCPSVYCTSSMGHFIRKKIYIQIIQDYKPSSRSLFSVRSRFSATASPFFPRSDPSPVARSFPLYRVSFDLLPGAGSRSLHAPPKSKICPLWLILPFQTTGTENSQTV
ncbi:hypothetical protein TNCV_1647831 [Trichonephila clavipes]|uniref:Uncharacterized protein n=1 Tax=Trichonephila clavipes TaxID=2585209 RepID=A0A8X6V2F3_TRICX|nr:hypothetical protein TNCV_1647831 [Trichonephila clavipes]